MTALARNLMPAASDVKARSQSSASHVPYLMLLLALAGVADASYVAHASFTGQPLREFFIEGANTVLNSPYARILGMPLPYFGVIFYSYMLALCALLAFDPFSRGLRVGALLYTALGVASSIYFMYLQVNFIRAICIYCAFSALITLVLFVAALWHFGATRRVATT
jgi:Vitamin K epoxide reductase family